MVGKRQYNYNRFDIILLVIVWSLWLGGLGIGLGLVRVLSILLFPLLLVNIKKSFFHVKSILFLFIIIEIYCVFSMLWSPNVEQGFKETIYNLMHFSLYLEVIVFSSIARKPLCSISYGWVFAVLCCSVVSIWEISTGQHLSLTYDYAEGGNRVIGNEMVEQYITAVTFGNYNSYVLFLCYCFPWLAYVYISNKKIAKRITPFVAMLMAFIFVMYNASRGGMLSLIIMIFIYLIFAQKSKIKLLFAFLIAGLLTIYLFQNAGDVVTLISYRMSGNFLKDNERTVLLYDGINLLLSTFGTGVGAGGGTTALKMSPHNLFLEIALDYGVLFTLIIFWHLLNLLIKSIKIKNKEIKMVLLMSMIPLPFYSVINSTYILQPQLFVFFATLYVFANYDRVYKKIKLNESYIIK